MRAAHSFKYTSVLTNVFTITATTKQKLDPPREIACQDNDVFSAIWNLSLNFQFQSLLDKVFLSSVWGTNKAQQ
jgi:hypothetical protein